MWAGGEGEEAVIPGGEGVPDGERCVSFLSVFSSILHVFILIYIWACFTLRSQSFTFWRSDHCDPCFRTGS